jgi:hypothetical protein
LTIYQNYDISLKRIYGGIIMPAIRKSADLMNGGLELYQKILIGLSQIRNGETIPEEKMMKKIRQYAGLRR